MGDPFYIKKPKTLEEAYLFGLGIGIYWGEGNKKNPYSVRMGNTDPELIKSYLKFLREICGVKENKIRFALQLFSDVDADSAKLFWLDALSASNDQFLPTINVINSGKIGTYKSKNQNGVLTVHVHNVKLRQWILERLVTPT